MVSPTHAVELRDGGPLRRAHTATATGDGRQGRPPLRRALWLRLSPTERGRARGGARGRRHWVRALPAARTVARAGWSALDSLWRADTRGRERPGAGGDCGQGQGA